VQAALLTDVQSVPRGVTLHDVTPLTLGCELYDSTVFKMIPRNTPIPHTVTDPYFCTAVDNQTVVCFSVYEGERTFKKDNRLLDKFTLTGIPSGPNGQEKFDVEFHINADGILNVTAKHRGSTGIWKRITVRTGNGILSEEEIAAMLRDAELHANESQVIKERSVAKAELEVFIDQLSRLLDSGFEDLLSASASRDLRKSIQDTRRWTNSPGMAEASEYQGKQQALTSAIESAAQKSKREGVLPSRLLPISLLYHVTCHCHRLER
jgi:endoplasmic reticulum chaperone BiP